VTTRFTETALVVGVRGDPGARELRSDVPIAARVLRDAVNEEEVRLGCARGWPEVGPQLEAVT